MPTLDDVLDTTAETSRLHPRLRRWASLIEKGSIARLEVFRPESSLGFSQSEMNVHFDDSNGTPLLETVPWDDDFNAGLIDLGVQALDTANEVERFALGLRAALRRAEREFGDGYFNAVLYEFVTESDLTRYPEIAAVIKHASANRPNPGKGYNSCREMIADAIAGRKYELEKRLRYQPSEARSVLVSALSKYLDERFTVTSRRRLGLL